MARGATKSAGLISQETAVTRIRLTAAQATVRYLASQFVAQRLERQSASD